MDHCLFLTVAKGELSAGTSAGEDMVYFANADFDDIFVVPSLKLKGATVSQEGGLCLKNM